MTVTVADDPGPVGAERVRDALVGALADRDVATLCLSGGTSPDPVLDRLPDLLPVSVVARLVVTWTDERVVPYGGPWRTWDPAVNRRAAWARWFSRLPSPPRERPLWSGSGTPDAASVPFAPLDVLLLGFGPDGHLASLFPGHPALEAVGTAVLVPDAPKPPPLRVSLTLPALRTARRVIGLASGAAKGAILRRARGGDLSLPLGRYGASAVDWVVDREAAAALEG